MPRSDMIGASTQQGIKMIDIDNLTYGQLKQIAQMFSAAPAAPKRMIGEYVVVRCRDAGVHAGILIDYEGRTVHLEKSRRLWRWQAKQGISLSAIAEHGLDHAQSRVANEITVVLSDACEIIATSEEAARSIKTAPVAEQS